MSRTADSVSMKADGVSMKAGQDVLADKIAVLHQQLEAALGEENYDLCDAINAVRHPGDNIRANGTSQKWTPP